MLIVDDKWLFIGPNRHGSLYAAAVLQAAFRCQPVGGSRPSHTPLCKVPAEQREGKIVVGTVRCPLRWYVSKWAMFCKESPHKQYDFLTYFYRHWDKPHGPIGKNTQDLPLPVADLGGWSYNHVAYHSLDAAWALGHLDSASLVARNSIDALLHADEMLCTETLSDDLVRVFGKAVIPHLNKSRNATNPGPFASYYGPEELRLVREKDGWLAVHYPDLDCHDIWRQSC